MRTSLCTSDFRIGTISLTVELFAYCFRVIWISFCLQNSIIARKLLKGIIFSVTWLRSQIPDEERFVFRISCIENKARWPSSDKTRSSSQWRWLVFEWRGIAPRLVDVQGWSNWNCEDFQETVERHVCYSRGESCRSSQRHHMWLQDQNKHQPVYHKRHSAPLWCTYAFCSFLSVSQTSLPLFVATRTFGLRRMAREARVPIPCFVRTPASASRFAKKTISCKSLTKRDDPHQGGHTATITRSCGDTDDSKCFVGYFRGQFLIRRRQAAPRKDSVEIRSAVALETSAIARLQYSSPTRLF